MKKIGFWTVFGIVTGSQIGTGIFMMPGTLAQFGYYSIIGWLIACIGAISLAYVFANLCSLYPKIGGPHAYVKEALGDNLAFFTGSTYWIISWVSSSVVVIATVSYAKPMIPDYSQDFYLGLQIFFVLLVTLINFYGVRFAGFIEMILTVFKFIPLILIPILAIWKFDINNFIISQENLVKSPILLSSQVTLLALWCFIGLESATSTAGSVENPSVTIPLAIISGTFTLTILYLLNHVSVVGLVPYNVLVSSDSPYVEAVHSLFSGNWNIIISFALFLVCLGTFNAWTLISGQIAIGLANEGYFPQIFGKQNKYGAPYFALISSGIGISIILLVTFQADLLEQLSFLIDISVITFLYVYLICCISYIVIHYRLRMPFGLKIFSSFFGSIFCIWVISNSSILENSIGVLFVLLGFPLFILYKFRLLSKVE